MNTWQQSPVQVNMDLSYIDPTEVTPGFGIQKVRVNSLVSISSIRDYTMG